MPITLGDSSRYDGVGLYFGNFESQTTSGTNISYGYNQQWVDVSSNRILNTLYTNTAGRGIYIIVTSNVSTVNSLWLKVNPNDVNYDTAFTVYSNSGVGRSYVFGFIPKASQYSVRTINQYPGSLGVWLELTL